MGEEIFPNTHRWDGDFVWFSFGGRMLLLPCHSEFDLLAETQEEQTKYSYSIFYDCLDVSGFLTTTFWWFG